MNEIIAVLLPSFLALKIFTHINKEKMKIVDLVIYYFIFVFLINLVVHVISVYIMGKVLKWIKKNGGLAKMAEHNQDKAKLIYDVIDQHPDFFKGHASPESRSFMNITFRLPSEELEANFVKQALASGMSGLKGHRSVGGLRASIYNGMPREGCKALAEFMLEFMRKA